MECYIFTCCNQAGVIYLDTNLIFLEHVSTRITASISLQELLGKPTIKALIIFPFEIRAALSNTIHLYKRSASRME